jgi:hypothetical protein
VPGGHARNQGRGTVATGHPEHVGPTGGRGLGQGDHILARPHHDRFDAPCPALSDKTEPLRLPASAARVDEQHGVPGRRNGQAGRQAARPDTGAPAGHEPVHGRHPRADAGRRVRTSPHPTSSPTAAPITAPITTSPG